jgi:hypothetical protein
MPSLCTRRGSHRVPVGGMAPVPLRAGLGKSSAGAEVSFFFFSKIINRSSASSRIMPSLCTRRGSHRVPVGGMAPVHWQMDWSTYVSYFVPGSANPVQARRFLFSSFLKSSTALLPPPGSPVQPLRACTGFAEPGTKRLKKTTRELFKGFSGCRG